MYRAMFSSEEYESYSSPNINEEKFFKAIKILLSGCELKTSENDKYVLMETNKNGFAFVNVFDDNRIMNGDWSFENVTSLINNMDDELLETQYTRFCLNRSIKR